LNIEERLKIENHFILEGEIQKILEKYRDIASFCISENELLYRARIGYKEIKRAVSNGFEVENHYLPFTGLDIGAPKPYLATGGRVNRTGVSFLYCATDKYTAISEVRPHPGDIVSIAKFRLKNVLSVFNLYDSQLLHFFESDNVLDTYKEFHTLGVLLNRTIPPADRINYSITQLIADGIRRLGFAGVLYCSTVGTGKNLVLFDHNVVEQIVDESDIVCIDSVKYEYSHAKIFKEDDDYL
jgi:RES domain-containing protein